MEYYEKRVLSPPILDKWSRFKLPESWSRPGNDCNIYFLNLPDTFILFILNQKSMANYWSSMGVDGFYLRDIPFLFEDNSFTNEPQLSSSQDYSSLSHNYTRDLADSYQTVVNIFTGAMQPRNGQEKWLPFISLIAIGYKKLTFINGIVRLLIIESNDRVMSDERWTQPYKMMTTSALYKLSQNFNGLQLKTVVQQYIESFNKTNVTIKPLYT